MLCFLTRLFHRLFARWLPLLFHRRSEAHTINRKLSIFRSIRRSSEKQKQISFHAFCFRCENCWIDKLFARFWARTISLKSFLPNEEKNSYEKKRTYSDKKNKYSDFFVGVSQKPGKWMNKNLTSNGQKSMFTRVQQFDYYLGSLISFFNLSTKSHMNWQPNAMILTVFELMEIRVHGKMDEIAKCLIERKLLLLIHTRTPIAPISFELRQWRRTHEQMHSKNKSLLSIPLVDCFQQNRYFLFFLFALWFSSFSQFECKVHDFFFHFPFTKK